MVFCVRNGNEFASSELFLADEFLGVLMNCLRFGVGFRTFISGAEIRSIWLKEEDLRYPLAAWTCVLFAGIFLLFEASSPPASCLSPLNGSSPKTNRLSPCLWGDTLLGLPFSISKLKEISGRPDFGVLDLAFALFFQPV